MKTNHLLLSLSALLTLSACGGQFNGAAGTSSATSNAPANSSGTSSNEAPSNKILQDIGTSLRQKSLSSSMGISLSESQILALLMSGKTALSLSGLASSADINATIPAIVQGITQALGTQVPGINNSQLASLISALGTSALDAALISSGGSLTAGFVQVIATTLFQNLSSAGINSNNLPTASSALIANLVSHLGNSGFQASDLSTLLQSLSNGAVLGVGNLNLNALGTNLLADILNKMGSGSILGLTGVTSQAGLLQALIGSLTTGSKLGLTQVMGAHTKLGLNLTQLLTSLVSGQNLSVGALPIAGIEQQLISGFLQNLISKL